MLLNSTRLSRRATTRPGFVSRPTADRLRRLSIDVVSAAMSVLGKGGIPAGGICPAFTLVRTLSHTSGCFDAEISSWKASRFRFAVESFWLWHEKQFFARMGRTSSGNEGTCPDKVCIQATEASALVANIDEVSHFCKALSP